VSLGVVNLNLRKTYKYVLVLLQAHLMGPSVKFLLSPVLKVGNNLSLAGLQVNKFSGYVSIYLYSLSLTQFVKSKFGAEANLIFVNYFAVSRYYFVSSFIKKPGLRGSLTPTCNKSYAVGFLSAHLQNYLLSETNYRRAIRSFVFDVKNTGLSGFNIVFKGKLRKLRSNVFNYGFGSVSKGSNTAIYTQSDFTILNKVGLSKIVCSANTGVSTDLKLDCHNYSCV
jgi:hypothetical protein